jgi:hypothetical protein
MREKIDSLYSNMIMCWVNTGSDQFSNSEYFANIRKHLIWENKYLLFNNSVNTHLNYMNDLVDEKEK